MGKSLRYVFTMLIAVQLLFAGTLPVLSLSGSYGKALVPELFITGIDNARYAFILRTVCVAVERVLAEDRREALEDAFNALEEDLLSYAYGTEEVMAFLLQRDRVLISIPAIDIELRYGFTGHIQETPVFGEAVRVEELDLGNGFSRQIVHYPSDPGARDRRVYAFRQYARSANMRALSGMEGRVDRISGPRSRPALASAYADLSVPRAPPELVEIEITNYCNLHCEVCERGRVDFVQGKRRDLSVEDFKRIIDSYDYPMEVFQFSGTSEPTFNPGLVEMVEHVVRTKAPRKVELITNGTNLTEELSRELIRAGLNSIKISIDAPDEATYRKARGASLRVVKDNLRALNRVIEEMGVRDSFFYGVNCVVYSTNLQTVVDMPALLSEVGASTLEFRLFETNLPRLSALAVHDRELLEDLENTVRRSCAEKGVEFHFFKGLDDSESGECNMLRQAHINHLGHLTPCYHLPHMSVRVLGGIPFSRIWNDERLRAIARDNQRGAFLPGCNCLKSIMLSSGRRGVLSLERVFGDTGLSFFCLGTGSIWLGRRWPSDNEGYVLPEDEEVEAYLDRVFRDLSSLDGRVMIDTAAAYGLSEERLGVYFRQYPEKLDRAFIATKWGEDFDAMTGKSTIDHSEERLSSSIRRSHERLGRVDLLYIHGTTVEVLRDEPVISEMERMKREHEYGISLIGASISKGGVLETSLAEGLLDRLDVIQVPAYLIMEKPHLIRALHQQGKAVVVNSPVRALREWHPRQAYAELLKEGAVSVILTGTRNHLPEVVGYVRDGTLPEGYYDEDVSKHLLSRLEGLFQGESRSYTIRFDRDRLTPSQVDLIAHYARLLETSSRGLAQVTLRPFSGERRPDESLLSVRCDAPGFTATGHVDVVLPEGERMDGYLLRVQGMLNMALAASSIPEEISMSELSASYGDLLRYIRLQYRDIMGAELSLSDDIDVLQSQIRHLTLVLPEAYRMPLEKIEEYNRALRRILMMV